MYEINKCDGESSAFVKGYFNSIILKDAWNIEYANSSLRRKNWHTTNVSSLSLRKEKLNSRRFEFNIVYV